MTPSSSVVCHAEATSRYVDMPHPTPRHPYMTRKSIYAKARVSRARFSARWHIQVYIYICIYIYIHMWGFVHKWCTPKTVADSLWIIAKWTWMVLTGTTMDNPMYHTPLRWIDTSAWGMCCSPAHFQHRTWKRFPWQHADHQLRMHIYVYVYLQLLRGTFFAKDMFYIPSATCEGPWIVHFRP